MTDTAYSQSCVKAKKVDYTECVELRSLEGRERAGAEWVTCHKTWFYGGRLVLM